MRFLIAFTVLAAGLAPLSAAGMKSGPVAFRTHVIESKMPGGYSVLATDVNKDGKLDVIGMTSRLTELAWYENPSWERHVMVKEMKGLVNMAAHDIDGDGIPEFVIENEFSMVAANSPGLVWLVKSQGDPRQPWKMTKIDQLITSHHVAWADIDGDGKKELINAPLIGPKGLAPTYDQDQVPLVYYHVPANPEGEWKRLMIDDKLNGVLHRARAVQWTPGKRQSILTAGFEGIVLHQATGKGEKIRWQNTVLSKGHEEKAPRAGASDVAVGHIGKKRILASVQPWHGNQVVVYTQEKGGWKRNIIFDKLAEGHEVCVGDFNGDGRDDVVAGDRARGQISESHVFFSEDDVGTKWHHEVLDPKGMSASGCQVADINGDGRPDIVMIGGATANIKWYENLGKQ
ncbi:MAG: VCBS repeat-containing protein [Bryobacterales bacterium]|nr:VCBS repeat-containing protein [Bryobacterales bacterium]